MQSKDSDLGDKELLQKLLEWDIDLGQSPTLTIAKRYARETTNDKGHVISPVTSELVFIELKKYFFLCIKEVEKDRKKYET